ncbi:lipopolysaccharide transport system ATP-binding protein [Bosea sp. 124]|nr:lipopolysaccharide transport system ATP-binding protein [Bosea sp. 124]
MPETTQNGDDEFAIRIEGVSKVYGLWSSPGARLNHVMLEMAKSVVPAGSGLERRIDRKVASIYREFPALRPMSLEIRKGESWGFIGVNGSGKSTLLKMISGNLRPSSGRIEVNGRVAILDYSSGLHGDFTGRENIFLKAAVLGMTRRDTEAKLSSIIDFADIGEFIDQPVKTYSSGMMARLGFAIVAHTEADIIITDEALAVGDAFFVQKCMDFIRGFLKRGTFLFVSHSTNDVISLCQKAAWLDHGQVRRIGSARDVADAYLNSHALDHSERYLKSQQQSEAAANQQEPSDVEQPVSPLPAPVAPRARKHVKLNARQIAQLQDYVAPALSNRHPQHQAVIAMDVTAKLSPEDIMNKGHGTGGAKIVFVKLLDNEGRILPFVIGGEEVALRIECIAERKIARPILGFQLRNNLGLTLFANNTASVMTDRDLSVEAGQIMTVDIVFAMPLLQVGDYVVRVGLADGEEASNALLDMQQEALLIQCRTSGSRHGLVNQPLLSVEFRVRDDEGVIAILEGDPT